MLLRHIPSMKTTRCSAFACAIPVALLFVSAPLARAQEVVPLDKRDMAKAEQMIVAGKFAEALTLYEGIPKDYPTSIYIPNGNLGAAICYYFLKNYDKAIESAEKNTKLKTPPDPAVLERSLVLIPQSHLAKADAMKQEDPLRTKAYEDAVRAFDEVIRRFPNSEEVESANYGKGRAQLSADKFEDAAVSFRANVQKFPQSPSILDSQFLLAISLSLQAQRAMQAETAADATIPPLLEEADRLLRDIDAKRTDLALANRARFQLGGVLEARAILAKKGSPEQTALQKSALDAYRAVAPKEVVVQIQEARIASFAAQRVAEGVKGSVAGLRRFDRLLEKEREKLEIIKAEADQSIAAKINAAKIFVGLAKFDEARVLLRFVEQFITGESADEKEQKKQILYLTTVTYAAQQIADKALEGYDKWNAEFAKDPMGQNLGLLLGAAFLHPDPKKRDPEKAIKYFDEQIANFPDTPFSAEAAMQKSSAYMAQERYEEAQQALQKFISTSKDEALLAQAEFNLAIIFSQTGKTADAVTGFKTVRDKYPNSEQAEDAGFYLGQTLYAADDAKGALEELNAFITKFPQSKLVPQAFYVKARTLGKLGKKPDSLLAYAKVAQDYPDSEVAVPSFFERAATLLADEKPEDAATVMREFIARYPNAPQVYQAFSFIADVQVSKKKPLEGIKIYEEYLAKFPEEPAAAKAHVALANLWKKASEAMDGYLAIGAAEKERWKENYDKAIHHAQTAIEKYPETDAVSPALQVLLDVEQKRMTVGVRKPDEVEKYFTDLASQFEGKSTKSKILFALAGFFAAKDEKRSFEIMKKAFDTQLVYAPEDLDLYGTLLIENKNTGEALRVAEKLATDYPLPPNVLPEKASRTIGNAQANSMALRARILQAEGREAEGKKIFEELKAFYPWSAKVAEADLGIGAGLHAEKKYAEAIGVLAEVAKKLAAPVPLRAKAMLLLAKSLEAQGEYAEAINNYVKIGNFFESEAEIASEGLWLAGQLLEKQATGEIPMPVKKAPPKPAPKPLPKGAEKRAATAAAKPGAAPKAPVEGKAAPAEPTAAGAAGAPKTASTIPASADAAAK